MQKYFQVIKMLKRKIYEELKNWRKNKKNECLLVKGARQTGKTFIIDLFGRTEYKSYIKINFIENPELISLFDGDLSAVEIKKRLSLSFQNLSFINGNTLLFLDEIQMCPNARTALKFLALDNSIDVIASGSLLGIHYKNITSVPVGYEKQITMYGISFEEFLWANGYNEDKLKELFRYYEKKDKIPEIIHTNMMKLLKEYMVVGGMPAVVQAYITNYNFGEVQTLQENILASYMDDILKYASTYEKPKVRNCYLSIPRQLAKENTKFQFSVVEKKATARKFENSMEWLRDAGFVYLCNAVSTPSFPLKAYEKEGFYRAYMADIGLLIALYGFDMKKAIIDDSLSGAAKGGIYENLVEIMLINKGWKPNYYLSEDGSKEIEFLISKDASVIPIEVKANRGSTNSLNYFLRDEKINYGIKLSAGNIGFQDKKLSLPLYMAMFI